VRWWRNLVRTVLGAAQVRPLFRHNERVTTRGECDGIAFRVDSSPANVAIADRSDPGALGQVLVRALKGRAAAAALITSGNGVYLVTLGRLKDSGSDRPAGG
jgi:hypothetical protein